MGRKKKKRKKAKKILKENIEFYDFKKQILDTLNTTLKQKSKTMVFLGIIVGTFEEITPNLVSHCFPAYETMDNFRVNLLKECISKVGVKNLKKITSSMEDLDKPKLRYAKDYAEYIFCYLYKKSTNTKKRNTEQKNLRDFNPNNIFFSLCNFTIPMDIIGEIFSFCIIDRTFMNSAGLVNENWYLMSLISKRSIYVTPKSVYSFPVLVMKNVKEITIFDLEGKMYLRDMSYVLTTAVKLTSLSFHGNFLRLFNNLHKSQIVLPLCEKLRFSGLNLGYLCKYDMNSVYNFSKKEKRNIPHLTLPNTNQFPKLHSMEIPAFNIYVENTQSTILEKVKTLSILENKYVSYMKFPDCFSSLIYLCELTLNWSHDIENWEMLPSRENIEKITIKAFSIPGKQMISYFSYNQPENNASQTINAITQHCTNLQDLTIYFIYSDLPKLKKISKIKTLKRFTVEVNNELLRHENRFDILVQLDILFDWVVGNCERLEKFFVGGNIRSGCFLQGFKKIGIKDLKNFLLKVDKFNSS